MSSAQKNPLSTSLNRLSAKKAHDAIQVLGKSLPCTVVSVTGSIVTVNFEVQSGFNLPHVIVPIAGSEYIRLPIQMGCKGVVMAIDARIGNMSGLGAASPSDLTTPANLTALVFVPIGNTNFFSVPGNQTVIYGPNGVILEDSNIHCVLNLTPAGIAITLPSGGALTVNGGNIVAGDDVTISGKSFLNHIHLDVQPGSGVSGIPL
jgi:hypothetical protein